ncbi:MAG: anti-sigma factor [Alphaproteobacteria bacterium]|nr:anti-sigma factor [Alphaproteobacteria bacterium]MBV9375261.1 anti-sigma factor [Alphaproteobacteria bacterium]
MNFDPRAAEAPRGIPNLCKLWNEICAWRWAAGVLAILSLALLVASIIRRDPPDFSDMAIVAIVRDGEQHPVWAIRLARAAHQIAADSLRHQPAPPGQVYQLWLLAPDRAGPRQLGLLPLSGRKRIAVSPENARLLVGAGELVVTREPAGGSPDRVPSGQPVFRGTLESAG